jgi:hypothetical protein
LYIDRPNNQNLTMKKLLQVFVVAILTIGAVQAQPCNLTDASGCDCLDGSNDCDLLPDITAAESLLSDPSQNIETPGELGVSVSTPNIGYGPLKILPSDYFVCDGDTIFSPGGFTGTCPDGSDPRQIIYQRIYHKNPSGAMTYYDRFAGTMTYHESHGHMHVDDWGIYTIRQEIPGTDPLTWPILGDGSKLGFCLMDFGSCASYAGHCVDNAGNVILSDAPNLGLGGGNYSCGSTNQGITAGYTDIYSQYLDGMQVDIPTSVCNGDYMVVVHVDPYNYFLESDDVNNVVVVPITLTQQGGGAANIVTGGPTTFCEGEFVTLSIDQPATSYLWSTGETTSTIDVVEGASVTCTVNTTCGILITTPLAVNVNSADAPVVTDGITCGAGPVDLSATAAGTLRWFDAASGGAELATGSTFTTPSLSATTTYYVEHENGAAGATNYTGAFEHTGTSLYNGSTFNGALLFDAIEDFELVSVKVHTDIAGPREIELRSGGAVLQSVNVFVPVGESRVTLNMNISKGDGYEIGTNEGVNAASYTGISPELRRTSSSGLTYPYVISSVVSINESTFGASYYYYFFDWEVKEPDAICTSDREPVIATVDYSGSCGNCIAPANPVSSALSSNGATISWDSSGPSSDGYQIQGRVLGTTSWKKLVVLGAESRVITGLSSGTTHEWYVRARCIDGSITDFSPLTTFTTLSPRLAEDALQFDVFPNPNQGQFALKLLKGTGESGTIIIEDLLGRTITAISSESLVAGTQIEIDEVLNAGIYVIRIESGSYSAVQQFVVSE